MSKNFKVFSAMRSTMKRSMSIQNTNSAPALLLATALLLACESGTAAPTEGPAAPAAPAHTLKDGRIIVGTGPQPLGAFGNPQQPSELGYAPGTYFAVPTQYAVGFVMDANGVVTAGPLRPDNYCDSVWAEVQPGSKAVVLPDQIFVEVAGSAIGLPQYFVRAALRPTAASLNQARLGQALSFHNVALLGGTVYSADPNQVDQLDYLQTVRERYLESVASIAHRPEGAAIVADTPRLFDALSAALAQRHLELIDKSLKVSSQASSPSERKQLPFDLNPMRIDGYMALTPRLNLNPRQSALDGWFACERAL